MLSACHSAFYSGTRSVKMMLVSSHVTFYTPKTRSWLQRLQVANNDDSVPELPSLSWTRVEQYRSAPAYRVWGSWCKPPRGSFCPRSYSRVSLSPHKLVYRYIKKREEKHVRGPLASSLRMSPTILGHAPLRHVFIISVRVLGQEG